MQFLPWPPVHFKAVLSKGRGELARRKEKSEHMTNAINSLLFHVKTNVKLKLLSICKRNQKKLAIISHVQVILIRGQNSGKAMAKFMIDLNSPESVALCYSC